MRGLERLAFVFSGIRRLADEHSRMQAELADRDEALQQLAHKVNRLETDLLLARQQHASLAVDERAERLWVPAGHFPSPLVDPAEAAVQRAIDVEAHPRDTPEVFGISESEMTRWFQTVAKYYPSQPFPEFRTGGFRYYYSNPNFPLADALALLAFLLERRPRRFIEIGAGFSSCAAMDVNERYLHSSLQMTFIDPNPELIYSLVGSDPGHRFLKTKVQDVPLSVFAELQAGDILFIDSSHVAKTGSDVLDYMFRILPALAPNVAIHIHDVFFPFEYPKTWIVDENRSWNETYLLRAFLHGNPAFRVLYLSDWFYKCRRQLLDASMPLCVTHRGGSMWMESVARQDAGAGR